MQIKTMGSRSKMAILCISYLVLILTISLNLGCAGMQYQAPQLTTKSCSELFSWVKSVMPPVFDEGFDEVPEVYIVSRDEIRERMADAIDSDPLFKKWVEKYGRKSAEEMRAATIENVVTLCHMTTLKIYVVDGLSPCQTETQIAYGMAYYLMVSKYGRGDDLSFGQALMRRMYYGRISTIIKMAYFRTFCVKVETSKEPSKEAGEGDYI